MPSQFDRTVANALKKQLPRSRKLLIAYRYEKRLKPQATKLERAIARAETNLAAGKAMPMFNSLNSLERFI